MEGTASACVQAIRSRMGRTVGGVGEVDVARAEADRGYGGFDGQGRPVVPVVEAAEHARAANGTRGGERGSYDRGAPDRSRPAGHRRGAVDVRWMCGQPRVGLCRSVDPVAELTFHM